MKRELKEVLAQIGPSEDRLDRKADPDEKGTESRLHRLLHQVAHRLHRKADPDEKGTERFDLFTLSLTCEMDRKADPDEKGTESTCDGLNQISADPGSQS